MKGHSKQSQKHESSTFNSSIGVLLSCLGCVIGTGNIWRFPRIIATASYSQGSLTFLIAWVLSLFVWSLPLSIVEYTLGRYTRTSHGAFHRFRIWYG
uniref:SJCHGC02056 protein n=1 Tax=Schistosoma japonicum TaxID=6182 RepID=Q5BTB8_SCHJA|nr:SJCHGC02056 protein [Schistosoma japonicum]